VIPEKRDSVVEENIKRDSVLEDDIVAPNPQTNGAKLNVPTLDISRSASPLLEAMSARISENAVVDLKALDANDDPQLLRMSARVH
jgi:glucosamine-6-phosphate deaminase